MAISRSSFTSQYMYFKQWSSSSWAGVCEQVSLTSSGAVCKQVFLTSSGGVCEQVFLTHQPLKNCLLQCNCGPPMLRGNWSDKELWHIEKTAVTSLQREGLVALHNALWGKTSNPTTPKSSLYWSSDTRCSCPTVSQRSQGDSYWSSKLVLGHQGSKLHLIPSAQMYKVQKIWWCTIPWRTTNLACQNSGSRMIQPSYIGVDFAVPWLLKMEFLAIMWRYESVFFMPRHPRNSSRHYEWFIYWYISVLSETIRSYM